MLANPPFGVEWKQQRSHVEREAESLGYNGRFGAGLPRINDGSLLFLQHMLSKMRAPKDGGSRIAIVFNGSPLFTGDAGSGESNIRRWIIENDWLEAIVALPDQLFYNTGIATYIWVLTNRKRPRRKGRVQLIDARRFFVKMPKSLGNKRNKLGDPADRRGEPDQIGDLTRIFGSFRDGETRTFTEEDPIIREPVERERVVSKVFDNADFGFRKITIERPLRLDFAATPERLARLEVQRGFVTLAASSRKNEKAWLAEIEAGKRRQEAIRRFLADFVDVYGTVTWDDREAFLTALRELGHAAGVRLDASERKAVLRALGERDENAGICRDRNGDPDPDPELRDTESVPLKEDVGEYFRREVLPHVPDAWIDGSKTKIGYEIPFNRHFYRYEPPRPLGVIEADIKTLGAEITELLGEVTSTNLPPYPRYKPSAVEWIGDVPEHWEGLQLKYSASINDEVLAETADPDMELSYVDIGSVNAVKGISSTTKVSFEDAPSRARRIVRDGDTIVSTVRTYLRAIAAIQDPTPNTVVSTGFAVVRPRSVSAPFMSYALHESGFIEAIMARSVGVSYPAINAAEIGMLPIPIPETDEQQAIADFLDRETKKLDSLAAKIEIATERLHEYRAALITASVTGKIDTRAVDTPESGPSSGSSQREDLT